MIYTVKASELITHIKKFEGTKTLVKDFGYIADLLGPLMGCFLFQLPPSYHFSRARLHDILDQLDPARRNVVEFRHSSWWNDDVYAAFKAAGAIFCSCSGPRLPDPVIKTAELVAGAQERDDGRQLDAAFSTCAGDLFRPYQLAAFDFELGNLNF